MRLIQWRIPGRGPGGPGDPGPPLCLNKTDARRAKKFFWESALPPSPTPLISRSGSGAAIVAQSPCFKWNPGRSLCATSYVIVYDGSLPSPPPPPPFRTLWETGSPTIVGSHTIPLGRESERSHAMLCLILFFSLCFQDVFLRVIRQEGIFSLWKGFTPYYFRLGPHTVLTFIFLEQLQRLARQHYGATSTL